MGRFWECANRSHGLRDAGHQCRLQAGPRELLGAIHAPLAKTAKEEIADYGILMPSFLLEDSSSDDIQTIRTDVDRQFDPFVAG